MKELRKLCLAFRFGKLKKKGQVAIFVVVAILLVATILILFLILRDSSGGPSLEISPQNYISSCIKEELQEVLPIILENGGDVEQGFSIMYQGKNITYLCYTEEYYKQCVNQQPMLTEHIEQEITEYIEPKVKQCFSDLKQELEDKGYEVSMAGMELSTELQPKKVVVKTSRDLTVSKGSKTNNFKFFETSISSPLGKLVEITNNIVNQEALECDFDILVFMMLYPEYEAKQYRMDDSLIYHLKDRESNQIIKFAVRSCVLPPGI